MPVNMTAGKNVVLQDIKTNLYEKLANDSDQIRGVKHSWKSDELYAKTSSEYKSATTGKQTGKHATKAEEAKEIIQKAINNTINTSGLSEEAKKYAQEVLKDVTKDTSVTGKEKDYYLDKVALGKIIEKVETTLETAEVEVITKKVKPEFDKLNTLSQNSPLLATSKRPQVMVAMCQGGVGPLQTLQFYSDSFSSCSPLILYNSQTGIGGLFHIPAPSIDDYRDLDVRDGLKPFNEITYGYGDRPEVRESLKELIAMVQPDQVHLFPGSHGIQNDENKMNGITILETTELYLQADVKKMMSEVGVDPNGLTFHDDEPTGTLTVTANSNGTQLRIERGNDLEGTGGSEDLFAQKGKLSKTLDPYAVTRDHSKPEDTAVLFGSKFS